MEGSRPRGRPKRTWREVVQKDCRARKLNRELVSWSLTSLLQHKYGYIRDGLNREDAMDRSRWKKLIKIG